MGSNGGEVENGVERGGVRILGERNKYEMKTVELGVATARNA